MRCYCRAVGQPGLVTKDDVKEGVIVDVGNTPDENGKLKGDVEFEEVKEVAGAITPVPGGVGPLTITMVLNNTLLVKKCVVALNNVIILT